MNIAGKKNMDELINAAMHRVTKDTEEELQRLKERIFQKIENTADLLKTSTTLGVHDSELLRKAVFLCIKNVIPHMDVFNEPFVRVDLGNLSFVMNEPNNDRTTLLKQDKKYRIVLAILPVEDDQ